MLDKFDKNLHFTVDILQNEVPHFLDLELSPDGIIQFFEKTQTLVYILILQALYLGHIVLHELEALLHVHLVFAQQINCSLKSTPLKDLLSGMIFLMFLMLSIR